MSEKKYEDLEIDKIGMTSTTAGYGAMVVHWSSDSIGFGTLTILRDQEGGVTIKNETMTADFCKAVLCKLVDKYFKAP